MSRPAMLVSKLWAQAAILTFLAGFTGLGVLAALIYVDHAPIPGRVTDHDGNVVFTGDDVIAGQQIFQKFGLMQYGTIFGHGAYLGPDFTAEYLHAAALDMLEHYGGDGPASPAVRARVAQEWKRNAFDETSDTLTLSEGQAHAFERRTAHYRAYFGPVETQRDLRRPVIDDPAETRRLTSYFAWAAWATSANRPGKNHSY